MSGRSEDAPIAEQVPGRDGAPGGRSMLPGTVVVGVLVVIAIFASGYGIGERSAGRDGGSASDAIGEAYERISSDFVGEVDPETLVSAAISAMFETLQDPYSAYMGADRFDADLADISGEFEGIGAQLTNDDGSGATCEPLGDACRLTVVDVMDDTPAHAAGLQAGDEVRAIDDRPVGGLMFADAVALIRGPAGSDIELALTREGDELALTMTRARITVHDVRSETIAGGRVGYLRIDAFSAKAADDFHQQLRSRLDDGVEAVIVDVRGDPGGFVDAAVTIASEFLPDGTVYQEEWADGTRRSTEARAGGLATDPAIRVAVLIDGGSASASEILAGALGNRDRATLVGETTFGKGSIQEWTELPGDNGGFRLSVARWLLPDGSSVDGTGLVPDIAVARPGVGAGRRASIEEDPVVRAAIAAVMGEPGASPAPPDEPLPDDASPAARSSDPTSSPSASPAGG